MFAQARYGNSIATFNGYDKDAFTYVPIVIVGAGESGIAMGCRLKEKLGFDQFRIYDRQAGAGGTWWINRYPGVACDIPAVLYSFSFCQNPNWSSFFPPGSEIVKYFHDVAAKYQITDKIQCNTDVEGAEWLEDEHLWEVSLRHMVPGTGELSVKDRNARISKEGVQSVYISREKIRCKIFLSAVGGLVEPNAFPSDVPGVENFQGEIFHCSRWRHDVDLTDKNVVAVGTGCSAAQFVPELPKPPFNAKKVTQLMRTPPWVVPKSIPPGGKKSYSEHAPKIYNRYPFVMKAFRQLTCAFAEYDFRLFGSDDYAQKERAKLETQLLRNLHKTVPKKYHEILTPNYGVCCKRRIFDETWFRGLNDSRIELTTQPLMSVQARSITVGPGQCYPEMGPDVVSDQREIPADVIVIANGFETTRYLHPLKIKGRGGRDMVEEMEARGGPQAYHGMAMDNFPNCFLIFGPNTAQGHTSVILASENMVEYSLKFIEPILRGDISTVEVKREAEETYTADIQRANRGLVFNAGGCHSWYVHGDWNGTTYPYSQFWFWMMCLFPKWSDWDIRYTRKGLFKQRTIRAMRLMVAAMFVLSAQRARQSGLGLRYYTQLPQWAFQNAIAASTFLLSRFTRR